MLGRYDEAETALLEAYEILRAELYEAWGRMEQAEEWRATFVRLDPNRP